MLVVGNIVPLKWPYTLTPEERRKIWRGKHHRAKDRPGRKKYRARRKASGLTAHYARVSKLKNRYNMSLVDFDKLMIAQSHCCAICFKPFSDANDTHVDHDHATGHVRGLLCFKCNIGLGSFRDNPNLLTSAATYLTPCLTVLAK